MKFTISALTIISLLVCVIATTVQGQGTAFTYQGYLTDNGTPAVGSYDFLFTLYDEETDGSAIGGGAVARSGVVVSSGLFTVELDYGSGAFDSAEVWLEVEVQLAGGTSFDLLTPRQPVTPAPFAIKAASASTVAMGTISNPSFLGTTDTTPLQLAVNNQTAVSISSIGGGAEMELTGNLIIRNPERNGAIILSPSTGGRGVDPELVIQSAETGEGNNAPFHISRNAIFDTVPNAYQYIDDAGLAASKFEFSNSGDLKFSSASNGTGQVFFQDNMIIKRDGNVGIGTTSPAAKLDVTGAVRINDGTAAIGNVLTATSASGDAEWQSLPAPVWTENAGDIYRGSGNVGIGTSTPGFALEVNGTVRASRFNGGNNSVLSGNNGIIGGGSINTNIGNNAAIAAGERNRIEGARGFIGGGRFNVIETGTDNVIGGGQRNIIIQNGGSRGINAVIGGGRTNTCSQTFGVIGGGRLNVITNNNLSSILFSTIGGGDGNFSSACSGTIAGGWNNTNIAGFAPTVGGGRRNVADGNYTTVAGGRGNHALAGHATIPGGRDNEASGDYSFAAGRRAKALHDGAFVWADNSNEDLESSADNEFRVRATGGVVLSASVAGVGVMLPPGSGTWFPISDRNAKKEFRPVDTGEVLDKLCEIPLTTWQYKAQEGNVRHLGPMAQDFRAAFGLGIDERHISTVDADGVALAAIQGLRAEKNKEIAALKKSLAEKDAEIEELKAQVAEILRLVQETR